MWGGGKRSSNLELLRIIAMVAIVSHHYVVNSGITNHFDYANITLNMIFLQLWGMWGKTAINIFVMITGYFMPEKKLTVSRIAKMYFETKFYTVVLFVIFLICGYETAAPKNLFKMLFGNLYYIGNGFTASFLTFYLFIPFYNTLLEKLDRKNLFKLIVFCLGIYTGTSTFFFCESVFSEPIWYMILYFIAAYIRKYGAGMWFYNNRIIGSALICSIILAYMSVLIVDFVGSKFGFTAWSHMVSDSNKLLALMIGVEMFLFFNNMSLKYNKVINTIASTMFGVLCIHANSDAMRAWLWKTMFNVNSMYSKPLIVLMFHAVISVVLIFTICIAIDMGRIKFVETPVFVCLSKYKWFNLEL